MTCSKRVTMTHTRGRAALLFLLSMTGWAQTPLPTDTGKFDHREMSSFLDAKCETGTPFTQDNPLAPKDDAGEGRGARFRKSEACNGGRIHRTGGGVETPLVRTVRFPWFFILDRLI